MRILVAILALSLLGMGTVRDVVAGEPDSPRPPADVGGLVVCRADAARQPVTDPDRATDWVVVSGARVERWRVFLRIDGIPARQTRRNALRWLLKRYDADGSGTLSAAESKELPTPFGIRQLAIGRILPATGTPPKDADLDGDARLSLDELEFYYMGNDPSGLVCWGSSPHAMELSDSLAAALRPAGSRGQDHDFFQAATIKLLSRDSNGDNLVTPGELIDGVRYPGTSAASLARDSGATPILPLYPGPGGRVSPSTEGAHVLIRRLDHDGDGQLCRREFLPAGREFALLDEDASQSLDAEELADWIAGPPDQSWLADVSGQAVLFRQLDPATGDLGPAQTHLWFTSQNVWARIHGAPASWEAALEKMDELTSQFHELAGDSALDVRGHFAASPNQVEIQRLAALVDANRDGRADIAELASWREFVKLVLRSQIVISVVDFQNSLFACLDENHDGALSREELKAARRRIERAGGVARGRMDAPGLPRQLRLCVSLGRPAGLLDPQPAATPRWFQALDRNRDGAITRGEFPGTDEQFRAFQRDGAAGSSR